MSITTETTYSVAGKQLKLTTAADIEPYVSELSSKLGITKIDFSGNTIGIEASKRLGEAIAQHKDSLIEINFSDLYTGRLNTEIPQSLNYLLPALLECPKLTTVNLSDNAFGLQTIDPIEDYLSKAVSVEHLILSNNGMGPFAGARIGKSLYKLSKAKKVSGYNSLKTFVCGRNRLENGSINYLAIGLRSHKDLATVRLYQNGIRPAGAEKLITLGLVRNKQLQVLDLQDNTLTTRAASALAKALPEWSNLLELNLNDCLLKPKGCLVLTSALSDAQASKTLSILKLQYNELEPDSLKKLAQAAETSLLNLKSLELNGNRFDGELEDLEAIVSAIAKNASGEVDELDDLDSDEEEVSDEEDNEDTFDDIDANLSDLEADLASASSSDVDELTEKLGSTHIQS
ncbi:hypothetical protein PUMCH_000304 [Australozyma saopauloensis]|uniref:Ran GTPase-activating protein 1 n=1 Tax=Australozyma saopauloensis TaxID=291208 RepID=A0AAX4H3C5_9ASCO|nr:hypothetical protein PUMCH_000304 [[Candida] saopauloensis]